MKFPLVFFVILLLTSNVMAKKKKKAKKAVQEPLDDSKMFDSKTLKCLVCQNVVKEFEAAIFKVDPKKVIDTGTWRVNEGGEQKRQKESVIHPKIFYFSCKNIRYQFVFQFAFAFTSLIRLMARVTLGSPIC